MANPSSCIDYIRSSSGEWLLKGHSVEERTIKKLNNLQIPPAWTDVVISANPKSKVIAIGRDTAGRWQYRYSASHIARTTREKFDRIKHFSRDITSIRKQIKYDINTGKTEAFLLRLEDKTAIRIGSLADTKAKKKAYGLTTLKHEHVTFEGDSIILDFVAKKGIRARYKLTDDVLLPFLKERKENTKIGEYLFSDTSAKKLNNYLRYLSGNQYTVKDYRTFHATRIAFEELKSYSGKVFNKEEKTKIINSICKTVSDFLHNSPDMAKKSYIDPMVWELIGGI